jgi:hypothetical protein
MSKGDDKDERYRFSDSEGQLVGEIRRRTDSQRETYLPPTQDRAAVPAPALKFQKAQPGVPHTQLSREATGLLHEFSTPPLFNHSHRVFF